MIGYSSRSFESDSEYIYRHILDIRKTESPNALIERFRRLFIEGIDYPEAEVFKALNKIVMSEWASRELPDILNRCCYSLINYWWSKPGSELKYSKAVYELVALFKANPSSPARSEATQQLRKLVRDFTQTEQYRELQRKAWVSGYSPQAQNKPDTPTTEDVASRSIPDVIHRYPLLYFYYSFGEEGNNSGDLKATKCLQEKNEQQYEEDLFNYLTHMQKSSSDSYPDLSLTVENKNPTLLTPDKLKAAIMKFGGPVEGSLTYRDAAQQYLEALAQVKSYHMMKIQVHEYLSSSIKPSYGNHRFNKWLDEQLKNFLPQGDTWEPSQHLLMRTCSHLISTLLAKPDLHDCKSVKNKNHLMFIDLNANLKPTFTVGLLLKLVLLCADTSDNLSIIRSCIARHFADMCRHYESIVPASTGWLIECLENLMIAFSVNFGKRCFSDWTNLLAG
ncbi:MAG: hypothetical protein F6J86_04430 [Symploca sp. SIO1B1]|nr:hypothetical protein [Symploca sp. SIO1B1]